MVNIFGDATGKRGPPGPVGETGPAGKRGKKGENSGYSSQFFQHSNTKWDIDFKPNFWIDGYDIQEKPSFKLLNQYNHQYDATASSPATTPTKGTDLVSGRHTMSFDGSQFITCPMNWNTDVTIDNLQVFIVFKYNDVSGSTYRDGIIGNDNGNWDRFIALHSGNLILGGGTRNSLPITISSFPSDANPVQTTKFCVLSVHWNNKGTSGCGTDKSFVFCNGKKLATFSTDNIYGDTSFALGAVGITGDDKIKGEIGRFLVCGNRAHP